MASKKAKLKKDEPEAKADKKASKGKKDEAEESKYKRGDPRRVFENKLLKGLQSHYGKHLGSTGRQPEIARLSSGMAPLDARLNGGFAKGYWHIFFGPPSSTKTTTLLRTLGLAQKTCRNCNVLPEQPGQCGCGNFEPHVCAYIKLEEYNSAWAARYLDVDALILSEPHNAEEALDSMDVYVRSGEIDVVGVDSVAFLTPQKEIDKAVGEELVGMQARLVGKGIRKTNAGMAMVASQTAHRPTVFLTNQIRFKVGVMFGNPETQPGGQAPVFAAGTEIRFSAGEYHFPAGVKDEKKDKDNKEEKKAKDAVPDYVDFTFRIVKNKTGVPKAEGSVRMSLVNTPYKSLGDIIDEPWLLEQGVLAGVVEYKEGGSMYSILNREPVRGKEKAIELLMFDRKLYRDLRDTLMEIFRKLQMVDNTAVDTSAEEDDAALHVAADAAGDAPVQ